MTLRITSIEPESGATWGGNVVKVAGEGFGAAPRVLFGGLPAVVQLCDDDGCYVVAPQHPAGYADVEVVTNNHRCRAVDGYRYVRGVLGGESDLTRLVRALLRSLKEHVIEQTCLTVDVAYGGAGDDTAVAALATLPALIVSGPSLHENRPFSRNAGHETTDAEGRLVHYPPPYTVDLGFNVVGAAAQTVETLNLMNATIAFAQNVAQVSMLRDVEFPRLGDAHWPLEIIGDTRTHYDQPDGIKSFSCNLRVRGFDIAGSYPTRLIPITEAASVNLSKQGDRYD